MTVTDTHVRIALQPMTPNLVKVKVKVNVDLYSASS